MPWITYVQAYTPYECLENPTTWDTPDVPLWWTSYIVIKWSLYIITWCSWYHPSVTDFCIVYPRSSYHHTLLFMLRLTCRRRRRIWARRLPSWRCRACCFPELVVHCNSPSKQKKKRKNLHLFQLGSLLLGFCLGLLRLESASHPDNFFALKKNMNIEHFSVTRWEGGKSIFLWKLLKRAVHSEFNLFHEQHYCCALYVSIMW